MLIRTILPSCNLRAWRSEDKAALVRIGNNRKEAVGGKRIIAGEGIACYTGHFGYWLGEAYWGRGIATAAARAMVAQAFSGSQFARLEAPVFEWNPPSMRVLEKAGFVREGVLKRNAYKDGQQIDSVMYARVRDA